MAVRARGAEVRVGMPCRPDVRATWGNRAPRRRRASGPSGSRSSSIPVGHRTGFAPADRLTSEVESALYLACRAALEHVSGDEGTTSVRLTHVVEHVVDHADFRR